MAATLSRNKYDDWTFVFALTTPAGVPIDLTSYTFVFALLLGKNIITRISGGGITLNAGAGIVTAAVPRSFTSTLNNSNATNSYSIALQSLDPGGLQTTWVYDLLLTVNPGIQL